MCNRHLLNVLLLSVSVMFLACFSACASSVDEVDISTSKESYTIVVGENVPLDIEPRDHAYTVTSANSLIASVEDGVLHGGSVGETTIEVRLGDNIHSVKVRVYDKIVSRDTSSRNRYGSISSALDASRDDDIIHIEKGDYMESVTLAHDVTLHADEGVTIAAMTVQDDRRVTLENISFYTRDYPEDRMGSLTVGSGAYLTVDSCNFFVDKKRDEPKDRIGGYAIYVQPNSSFVTIKDCSIRGYNGGVMIGSTGGTIHVDSSRFYSVNTAITLDVREGENAPLNKPATGSIRGNIYYDVKREVDLLYNGDEYKGMLDIEHHDRIK